MKKVITRSLSIVLAVITIFSCLSSVGFASDETFAENDEIIQLEESEGSEEIEIPDASEENDDPSDPIEPTEPTEPTEPEVTLTWEDYDEVVEMYLCATASSLTGHVWLYFVNLTECEVPIGFASIKPGEEMSVGSLRNTRTNGGGTYYNGEASMAKNKDEKIRKNTTSLKMVLNPEQLKKVNGKICSMNFYNILVWNCGNFATSVWNSVSNLKFVHICFPIFTILAMKVCGAKQGAISMKNASEGEACFKQVKKGIKEIDRKCFAKDSCIG